MNESIVTRRGGLFVDGEVVISVKMGSHLSDESLCGVEDNSECLIVETEERSEFVI